MKRRARGYRKPDSYTRFGFDGADFSDQRCIVQAIRDGIPSEIVAAGTTIEAAEAALRLLNL